MIKSYKPWYIEYSKVFLQVLSMFQSSEESPDGIVTQ